MTDTSQQSEQRPETRRPKHLGNGPRRHNFMRGAALLGAVSLVALATTAFAFNRGFGPGFGHGPPDPEAMRAHMKVAVDRMLDKVDATDAQQTEIRTILDDAWVKHQDQRDQNRDLQEQLQVVLTADQVDRAALESLRTSQVERMAEMSRELTATLADVADVLTPEQRRELAQMHAQRFQ